MPNRKHSLVRMGLLKKRSDLDMEAFKRHWFSVHADLAGSLAGLRAYVQNRVVDHQQLGTGLPRGAEEYDGFSQLWFDDIEAMKAAITDLSQSLSADEVQFLGDLRIIVLHQHDIVPLTRNGRAVKHLSLLRRRPDISAETFATEWMRAHADLGATIAGIRGYRQSLIVARESPKNNPVAYDGLPLDGVAEVWFDSRDALDSAFASRSARPGLVDIPGLLAEVTTFLVEERIVVA